MENSILKIKTLKFHVALHSTANQYKCGNSHKSFQVERLLEISCNSSHAGKYDCKSCGSSFKSKSITL